MIHVSDITYTRRTYEQEPLQVPKGRVRLRTEIKLTRDHYTHPDYVRDISPEELKAQMVREHLIEVYGPAADELRRLTSVVLRECRPDRMVEVIDAINRVADRLPGCDYVKVRKPPL